MADFEILCFGETMAMFVAEQPGELDRVEQLASASPAPTATSPSASRRLGFAVAWLSRVGDDSLGRFVLDSLTREGLDCRFVEVDASAHRVPDEVPRGRWSRPAGRVLRRGSAASRLGLAHIREEMPAPATCTPLAIPSALGECLRTVPRTDAGCMRGRGASLSFDPNLRPSLWPSERRMIAEINAPPRMPTGSCRAWRKRPPPAAGRNPRISPFYLDMGVDAVAIKLGPSGAYYRDAHGEGLVPRRAGGDRGGHCGRGDVFLAVGVNSALLRSAAEVAHENAW